MGTWHDEPGVLELPDGRRIRGTAIGRPRGDVPPPDFALHLLGRDPGPRPWPSRWVRWRDLGTPGSTQEAVAALRDAHERAAEERVEIACRGGVGRTGSALAVVAVLAGIAPPDAVAWVREHYHPRAVETRRQQRWIGDAARIALDL